MDRIHQQQPQPTPVADDIHATPQQLLTRAAVDCTHAQTRREQQSGQDRINGMQAGGH
ncbi:MAG: hypothetical protein HOY79_49345 [Streptomyces sp.]|nr:hypothetical protein [Streptomyces sp.]